ncbi:hypothetical protein DFH08DRAFT_734997 [Mycena albidolilacea]|uniref:Uncharacterized protein n=1 Tax=Mycena albidolilacea TaxID=1033008 RepID=A0AAD7AGR3_9AGAR|nr:hypothetical protein DFH08DRAFT_734997 [Mycena albidolilacea]
MSSTNFGQCLDTIQSNSTLWHTGGTDFNGHTVTNVSQLLGMTYRMCLAQCGSAPEAFKFSSFSTQFSSFMLPFLALTAQLPFGASNYGDNFSTIMLTIGSPTLAIFSLMITVLNSRWIKRRFARISYPNSEQAVIILNNLQQSLLRVEKSTLDCRPPLLASRIVLAKNDQWWQRGAAALTFTHTWSMANIASVGWAVIAYVFTIASMDPTSMKIIGPAVACAWLWLLPLVVGWLQTSPNCDEVKIRTKLASLNQMVYIPGRGNDPAEPPVLAREITDQCAIEVWPPHRHGASPEDSDTYDEGRSPPFFNYARVFPWARSVEQIARGFEAASLRASERLTVNGSPWTTSERAGLIHISNRIGSAQAVANYIELEGKSQATCWAPEVWRRVIYASIVACTVQWLSTGPAIMAAWMTPTVGLGCHSASFLLHGVVATASFAIILLGVVVEQFYHSTNPHSYSLSASSHARYLTLSGLCRRIGKILAWSNGGLFIALDLLRFANIFDNCFCGSAVFGLGVNHGYNTVLYDHSMHFVNWWIASIVFATTAAFLFWISIFVLRA